MNTILKSLRYPLGLAMMATLALFFLQPVLAQDAPWEVPDEYKSYPNPIKRDAASIAKGKEIFTKNCILCHGEKGDGKGPSSATGSIKPANFTDKDRMKQSDGAMAYKILSGRGFMPPWDGKLSEDDVWNVINYIRGFGK